MLWMVIVVKKKLSNETVKDVYDVLQKHRARIKRRSILMASFVLGVNIFAWFVFISKADVKVNANIISWDVNFSDSSEVISKIVVETTDLYPGMPTYEKEIYITNYSDLKGTFDFDIKSIRVMDQEIVDENMTHENALSYLNSTFPFIVSFSSSKIGVASISRYSSSFSITIELTFTPFVVILGSIHFTVPETLE